MSVTRHTSVPPTPDGLQALSRPAGVIRLSWDPVSASNLLGYRLYGSATAFIRTIE